MKNDHRETFQHMIDQSLAVGLSVESEHSLREHLDTCVACREYLSASNRVIAGLRGLSFEVDPDLATRVLSSMLPPARPSRRRWVFSSVAAMVLTCGGSVVDLRCGDLLASIFDIQRMQMRQQLLAFWIVPSLCVLLLFPLLPLLSKAASGAERTQ